MELGQITDIEDRYAGRDGKPTLGDAYSALLHRWESGETDRETVLRLMFLAWYACSEPTWLTGLPENPAVNREVFRKAFEHLGGKKTDDPEVVFTVGLMASMFPYCCGDQTAWLSVGQSLTARYEAFPREHRVDADTFLGRGAYGGYFSQVGKSRW
jgi:hypothetical protein